MLRTLQLNPIAAKYIYSKLPAEQKDKVYREAKEAGMAIEAWIAYQVQGYESSPLPELVRKVQASLD